MQRHVIDDSNPSINYFFLESTEITYETTVTQSQFRKQKAATDKFTKLSSEPLVARKYLERRSCFGQKVALSLLVS
jgi:hypothetical protein